MKHIDFFLKCEYPRGDGYLQNFVRIRANESQKRNTNSNVLGMKTRSTRSRKSDESVQRSPDTSIGLSQMYLHVFIEVK